VVNKQIKPSENATEEMMYVSTSTNGMDAQMLSDVTQSGRYAIFICDEIPQHNAVNTVHCWNS